MGTKPLEALTGFRASRKASSKLWGASVEALRDVNSRI